MLLDKVVNTLILKNTNVAINISPGLIVAFSHGPIDIKKVYWYDKGINDKKPWHVICKIRPKCHTFYVYYLAGCDYTGFDCQGYMKMYISKLLKKLLNLAVPSKLFDNPKIRDLIIKSNK